MTNIPAHLVDKIRAGLKQAAEAGLAEPTAMTIATAGADGRISARTVLVKAATADGIVFYTNLHSKKGRQLRENPRIAACILWLELQQQIVLEGVVQQVSDAEADAYFATRPRISQLGAWASQQSQPLGSREQLESRLSEYTEKFAGRDVPRPPHWSGYRIRPDLIEFWHGREHRLHDRECWTLDGNGQWRSQRLYP